MLDRLREAGLVLGVVSNFEAWLERLLDELGVTHYFSVRVISGVEGMEKPDPRIFELAMSRAGVSAEASVYVGDNPEFDVDPALAVGMFPVLIDRRQRFPDSPATRIDSMDEPRRFRPVTDSLHGGRPAPLPELREAEQMRDARQRAPSRR
jgi:putative hydrolase of the HAD superfamily